LDELRERKRERTALLLSRDTNTEPGDGSPHFKQRLLSPESSSSGTGWSHWQPGGLGSTGSARYGSKKVAHQTTPVTVVGFGPSVIPVQPI
jgi:hypothetical protein